MISAPLPRYGKKLKTRKQHAEPRRRAKKRALANRRALGRKAPQFSGVTRALPSEGAAPRLCRRRPSLSGLSGPREGLEQPTEVRRDSGPGPGRGDDGGSGGGPAASRRRSQSRRRAPPYCGASPAGRAGAERGRRPTHPPRLTRAAPERRGRRYSPGEGRRAAAARSTRAAAAESGGPASPRYLWGAAAAGRAPPALSREEGASPPPRVTAAVGRERPAGRGRGGRCRAGGYAYAPQRQAGV